MVQEDPNQLVPYPVVPEVFTLVEPTLKPPTSPVMPTLVKERMIAQPESFASHIVSKVGVQISTTTSTETVPDLAMEAIPEHLNLPVTVPEATYEQLASHVVPTEINPICHVMFSKPRRSSRGILGGYSRASEVTLYGHGGHL